MKKVFATKAFILLTLFFISIAVLSFVAFHETGDVCTGIKKCSQGTPGQNKGEILWDIFSRQLVSVVSL